MAGIADLNAAKSAAYDGALAGTRIDANDPQFISDISGVLANANRIPNVEGARDATLKALESRISHASRRVAAGMDAPAEHV